MGRVRIIFIISCVVASCLSGAAAAHDDPGAALPVDTIVRTPPLELARVSGMEQGEPGGTSSSHAGCLGLPRATADRPD
ncbi:MAG: hypothetical protein M3217_04400, partial [Actinomycetota bacterium]|nr:hypothetical protein [Actinomycetota bacterium]